MAWDTGNTDKAVITDREEATDKVVTTGTGKAVTTGTDKAVTMDREEATDKAVTTDTDKVVTTATDRVVIRVINKAEAITGNEPSKDERLITRCTPLYYF